MSGVARPGSHLALVDRSVHASTARLASDVCGFRRLHTEVAPKIRAATQTSAHHRFIRIAPPWQPARNTTSGHRP